MRLFVGIELPAALQNAAAASAGQLRARLDTDAPKTTLRWIPSASLHLTLFFLGEIADTRVQDLERALSRPYGVAPFTLRIGGAGMFPASGRPRVLWFGIRSGGEGLTALHQSVGERLVSIGLAVEKRPFSAHLTMARFKDAGRLDVGAIRAAVARATVDVGECRVSYLTLFRSHVSSSGSRYEHLLRVPLV